MPFPLILLTWYIILVWLAPVSNVWLQCQQCITHLPAFETLEQKGLSHTDLNNAGGSPGFSRAAGRGISFASSSQRMSSILQLENKAKKQRRTVTAQIKISYALCFLLKPSCLTLSFVTPISEFFCFAFSF
jgi:hypothetical protein